MTIFFWKRKGKRALFFERNNMHALNWGVFIELFMFQLSDHLIFSRLLGIITLRSDV